MTAVCTEQASGKALAPACDNCLPTDTFLTQTFVTGLNIYHVTILNVKVYIMCQVGVPSYYAFGSIL